MEVVPTLTAAQKVNAPGGQRRYPSPALLLPAGSDDIKVSVDYLSWKRQHWGRGSIPRAGDDDAGAVDAQSNSIPRAGSDGIEAQCRHSERAAKTSVLRFDVFRRAATASKPSVDAPSGQQRRL
eukprot:1973262-Rhodomonas_salina.1